MPRAIGCGNASPACALNTATNREPRLCVHSWGFTFAVAKIESLFTQADAIERAVTIARQRADKVAQAILARVSRGIVGVTLGGRPESAWLPIAQSAKKHCLSTRPQAIRDARSARQVVAHSRPSARRAGCICHPILRAEGLHAADQANYSPDRIGVPVVEGISTRETHHVDGRQSKTGRAEFSGNG